MIKTQSICLNMIVKNEAHIIIQTLNNLLKYIPLTYWVICDTGSTDATRQVIELFFANKKIKGEMHKCEWKGFGKSRSEALEKAFNKTDYLFIFDADDTICGNFKVPSPMNVDKYHLQFGKGFTYTRPLLVNNRKKWKYVGVLHEYLTEMEGSCGSQIILKGDYHIDSGRLGARSQQCNQVEKYSKDAVTFEKEMAIEPDKQLCDRYAFYLAQSYKDAGNVNKAIEWYENVLTRQNWPQEKYFACITLGDMYDNLKKDFEKSVFYYQKSSEYDNERFDGLITLMELFCGKNMHLLTDMTYTQIQKNYHKINLDNKLFVKEYLYTEVMDYTNVISCYWSKNLASGYESIKKIATAHKLPQYKMNITLNNMIFYQDQMREEPNVKESVALFHNIVQILEKKCGGTAREGITINECTIFQLLLEKAKPSLTKYKKHKLKDNANELFPEIMITFTTCKRFNLFTQTINSILNTWTDVSRIDTWFVVDDNSSEEDRINMKRLYPWLNFYLKTPEEKGHLKSMNIIWDELKKRKPKYWIHMEDDFLFFNCGSYITHGIDGLLLPAFQKNKVKQMLFNRSYGETIDAYNIVSHEYLKDISDFCMQNFKENSGVNAPNCHYWPHFSFRPSIMETATILDLGNFNTDVTFFEREYSNKYEKAGFKSGFFNKITNIHTGRLTKDKDNTSIPNAYQLNSQSQFHASQQYENPSTTHSVSNDAKQTIETILSQLKTNDPTFLENNPTYCIDKINTKLTECKSEIRITSFENQPVSPNYNHITPVSPTNKIQTNTNITLNIQETPAIKIINLSRRQDRKINVEAKLKKQGYATNEYEFVEAVDGLKLETTDEIIDMFHGNDFGNRKGVIGCALSHINMWKQLLTDPEHDFYIILEDDVTFADNMKDKLAETHNAMVTTDMVFLGYHMFNKQRKQFSNIYNQDCTTTIAPVVQPYNKNLYIGGFFMYSINKVGAQKLVEYIEANGVKHGIDYIIKKMNNLNIQECVPQICFSVWNEAGAKIDTDIQNTGVSMSLQRSDVKDPDFVFIPKMDQVNYDLGQIHVPISKLKKLVQSRPDCLAFNTLHFLKSNVNNLLVSNYFGNNDGIYVKTEAYNAYMALKDVIQISTSCRLRVKMIGNWCSSKKLCEEWSVMSQRNSENGFIWNDIEFTWDNDRIDYYVIVNKPRDNEYFIPEKTIVLQMEPWVDDPKCNWGTKTWGAWANPDERRFLKVIGRKSANFKTECMNIYWQLELNYNQLSQPTVDNVKHDTVACICSSKYYDPGHIHRVDFLNYIETKQREMMVDEKATNQGFTLAIFSKTNFGKFLGYQGSLPMSKKSMGYLPYKYYFMCENNYEVNYVTEKLWEPILCECLCFYYGCPNVADYVDSRAYVQLDMNDFDKSYEIMAQAVREDWWSQRIEHIKKEKHRILNEMQFCPRIEKIIQEYEIV